MKQIHILIILILGISYSFAQTNIIGYEYWFNNDFANKTNTTVAATQQLTLNQNIPTAGLADGINVFNFRSYDDSAKYSAVLSEFFYKMPVNITSTTNLVSYEYWFNNDFANAVTVNTAVQGQVAINELIGAQLLADGINVFNIRFKDSKNKYSAVLSEFFYKMPATTTSTTNLVSYEYWFNNDFANAITVNTAVQNQIAINELIDAQSLTNGVHLFNIRFKDENSLWSSTMTEFFYKMPVQTLTNNLITDYRYWLNDDFANAENISLQIPVAQISLIDNLDFTQIPKDVYTIHFQFKDTLGLWSAVTTDTITKISLPIADFSYTTNIACDSNLVFFTDLSIDGDVYLWNFGDGNTDTAANPSHTFYVPNTYQVSLTVTDTLLGTDSTLVLPLVIDILNTTSSISETVCDNYTAPDGQIFTTSGIKTAVIPNAMACDSIITIDLTILNSTASSISETVCETYTAPDNQVYTTSGIKTAVIPNTAGCDSIITIDLTVLKSTTSSITETVCDTYTAPDNQVYTTSGIKTVVIPNIAGCDSTITIDLTVLNSTTSSISETACDTYTAPDGQIYSTSGIKTAVIPNIAGCDSTMTIDLTILNSTTSSISETACDSYTAPDGQEYTTSGIKTAVILNTAGCDSTITIDLSINIVDVAVTQNGATLTANTTGATYKWLDCNNGNAEIVGETKQAFTAIQNGSYAVEITKNNCTAISTCYTVTGVRIIENDFENEIILYPNPTEGNFSIDLGASHEEVKISVMDLNGKLVYENTYHHSQLLNLKLDEATGVYLLQIKSGNKKSVIRLVIE